MSASFHFERGLLVLVNNARMGILEVILRPRFDDCKDISDKIFFHYDLYDGPIVFTELTQEEYMKAYYIMLKAFEVDLDKNSELEDSSKKIAIDLWLNEFKPKMKSASLYNDEIKNV